MITSRHRRLSSPRRTRHVHAVGEQVGVAHEVQSAALERPMLLAPALRQPRDRRRRQPRGVLAEQVAQRRREVPRRQPAQVEHRQHVGHARRPTRVARQDPAREPAPLAGLRIDALVVHARRAHRKRARPDRHTPLLPTTVAHHQPPTIPVELVAQRAQRTDRPRPRAPRRSSAAHPHARAHRATRPSSAPSTGSLRTSSMVCLPAGPHRHRS